MFFLCLLISILALSPLPFGSAPPFWQSLLAAISLLAVSAAGFSRQAGVTWPPIGIRPAGWSALLFGAVMTWILFQALVPSRWAHPAWEQAQEILGGTVRNTISLDPFATLTDAFSLLGTAGIFLVALGVSTNKDHARLLLRAIAVIASLYALYGLIAFFTGNTMVAWAPKRFYEGVLTSTFVNRNSFGVFVGLGLLASVAVLTSSITASMTGIDTHRDRLRTFLEGATTHHWIWFVIALTCATALFLTGSRGAVGATGLATTILVFMYLSARKTSASVLIGYTVGIVILATALLALSGDVLIDRLVNKLGDDTGSRSDVYFLALGTLHDHVWVGAGYGAFEDAFAIYGSGIGPLTPRLVYAHNVYLELATELGVPIATLLLASVAILVGLCVRGVVVRRRDRIYPSFAVAATLLVGIQGLFDFGIQTPAVSTFYAVILGLGVAQSTSSRR